MSVDTKIIILQDSDDEIAKKKVEMAVILNLYYQVFWKDPIRVI